MKFATAFIAGAAALAMAGSAIAAPDDKDAKPGKGKLAERGGADREQILTDDERKQLREAMTEVRGDPAVAAARSQLEEAHKAMRKAMHDALLKADPSLEPVLEKIKDAGPPRGGPLDRFGGKGPKKGPSKQDGE